MEKVSASEISGNPLKMPFGGLFLVLTTTRWRVNFLAYHTQVDIPIATPIDHSFVFP